MTSSLPSCEIYFIRHGETDWNAQGRVQGHTDIPLNAIGVNQASRLGELLAEVSFSAAFSSDLSRARQTAELILKPRSLAIIESPALRERNAGKLEGEMTSKLDDEIRSFFLSKEALVKETYLSTPWHPELETSHSVYQRVIHFLLPYLNQYPKEPILVVSHSGVLRSLLDHLSFIPLHRWVIANCGFIKMKMEKQSLHLLDFQGVSKKDMNSPILLKK